MITFPKIRRNPGGSHPSTEALHQTQSEPARGKSKIKREISNAGFGVGGQVYLHVSFLGHEFTRAAREVE